MLLTNETAQMLIVECSKVIPYPMNIMNKNGIIIASSDKTRIGTYHEGAAILIQEHKEELIINDHDALEGTRQGVNLPIRIKENLEGVIGITGDAHIVINFGKVIQKLTEVFLLNLELQKLENEIENQKIKFTEDLLNGKLNMAANEVKDLLNKFGIVNNGTAAIVGCSADVFTDMGYNASKIQHVLNIFKKQLNSSKWIVVYKNSIVLCIGFEKSVDDIYKTMAQLQQRVGDMLQMKISIGIGTLHRSFNHMDQSYRNASKALRLSQKTGEVTVYEQNLIDVILEDAVPQLAQIKNHHIIKRCTPQEIADIYHFLCAYIACDGSIGVLSDNMFVHKNTIQYRIQKINKLVEADIRQLKNLMEVYLVCKFYLFATADGGDEKE